MPHQQNTPTPDALIAHRRAVQISWAYPKEGTDARYSWELSLSTDPDVGRVLSVKRTFAKTNATAADIALELDGEELSQLVDMLNRAITRVGADKRRDEWQFLDPSRRGAK